MQPQTCFNVTCRKIVNYSPPLMLTAGTPYTWTQGSCQTWFCCRNSDCGNCSEWTITIWEQRLAPDGGSFAYECNHWRGPGYACN